MYEVKSHGVTIEWCSSKKDTLAAFENCTGRFKSLFFLDLATGHKKEITPQHLM